MFIRYLPIISILFVILLILGGIFLWWPKLQEVLDLRTELQIKELEVKQREEYPQKLLAVSRELEQYSEELDKIDDALPEEHSIPALFNYMQKTASENGLILDNLALTSVSDSKGEARVRDISFSAKVSGSYTAFKSFLSVIYRSSRIIDVDYIKFSSPVEEQLFSFSISLTTHSFKEIQEVAIDEEMEEL